MINKEDGLGLLASVGNILYIASETYDFSEEELEGINLALSILGDILCSNDLCEQCECCSDHCQCEKETV
jgi:hypothetical protein